MANWTYLNRVGGGGGGVWGSYTPENIQTVPQKLRKYNALQWNGLDFLWDSLYTVSYWK